jgi:hypothetical protein
VVGSATAAVVADWLSPVLIVLSGALLARSFWILYVHKRGTWPVKVLTWASAVFIVCFWTWRLFLSST